MNMNIISIWEEFESKVNNFESLEEVINFISKNYNMTKEEAAELNVVSDAAMSEYFEMKKLYRKKGKDSTLHDSISALYINGVFFGMFLLEYLKWDWPEKKE
jgi:hypothetical protein